MLALDPLTSTQAYEQSSRLSPIYHTENNLFFSKTTFVNHQHYSIKIKLDNGKIMAVCEKFGIIHNSIPVYFSRRLTFCPSNIKPNLFTFEASTKILIFSDFGLKGGARKTIHNTFLKHQESLQIFFEKPDKKLKKDTIKKLPLDTYSLAGIQFSYHEIDVCHFDDMNLTHFFRS